VTGALELRMQWRGRVKGIGGDWDDVAGEANCEGPLEGSLASGGGWRGQCRGEGSPFEMSFQWKLDAK
jgi:hypothetical protein